MVALVSGGKDSFYSMWLAAQEGHEIVAVANLCPQESDPDDLDSYMYQTVSWGVRESLRACMRPMRDTPCVCAAWSTPCVMSLCM